MKVLSMKFHKNPSSWFWDDTHDDRRKDMSKVTGAFGENANVPKTHRPTCVRKAYNFGTKMTAFVSCYMFECVTFTPVWC
jgi:hypothetical protein